MKEKIYENLLEARKEFLSEYSFLFDMFSKLSFEIDIIKDNKYSDNPWVDFEIFVYPDELSIKDLKKLIQCDKDFITDFDNSCIRFDKRYYLKK